MILEDTNGDGLADTAKYFTRARNKCTVRNLCIGKQGIVSQSPYVWVFYDDNGDDIADRKEIIISGYWR